MTYLKHDLSGDSIDVFNYYYDPVGVRDSLVNLAGLHSFTYDSLYQLTGVTHADSATNPNEYYRYDPVGNRDSSHLSSSYTVDAADRLTEDDSCYYGYDDAGRMIYRKNKVLGYGYDDAGRMINAKLRLSGDSTTFEYTVDGQLVKAYNDYIERQCAYDVIGNRIRKIIIENSDTTVVKYTYDGADLLFEKDDNDAVQIRYLYGPGIDHILESVDSVGTKQHFADPLGSVTRITDGTGTILKKLTYDSFGNIVADSGSVIADDVTYTGRELESDLGIYYYRARYYDPLTGRFIVGDPIDFHGGDVNFYRYAFNNPVSYSDPSGLKIDWIDPETGREYVFVNPLVRENLYRLNQGIIDQGFSDNSFTIQITGGDRHIDRFGEIRSLSNDSVVDNSSATSPHLIERGARAADFQLIGFCASERKNIFEKAIANTKFLHPANTGYYSGHIHIALPKDPIYWYQYPYQGPWNLPEEPITRHFRTQLR